MRANGPDGPQHRSDSPLISAVINTYNEESNLEYALRSVASWCREIVVVDMHSTDRTREIAARYTNRIFLVENEGYADAAREYAVSLATHEWILVLDADEVVPPTLGEKLVAIAAQDEVDYVTIYWINYIFGERIRHSGWGADKHARFFRRGHMQFTPEIHHFHHPSGRELLLEARDELMIWHFNYVDIHQWNEKANRYSSVEAQQLVRGGVRFSTWQLLHKPIKEFVRRFLRRRGYRDGWRGFALSLLTAFNEAVVLLKVRELEKNGPSDQVVATYAALREALVASEQVRSEDQT